MPFKALPLVHQGRFQLHDLRIYGTLDIDRIEIDSGILFQFLKERKAEPVQPGSSIQSRAQATPKIPQSLMHQENMQPGKLAKWVMNMMMILQDQAPH